MSVPAAEVAADFRDALQDLRLNSRPEISNLTLIAKENTEYAEAISTELENHIRSTRPEWKLPALYVLDSVVKNVGTPYTVYIGRNLYRTFMDAYLVMAQDTRKAMEGLLRTWKLPVPESMDPRPVFPNDVTMDIENALTKIRAVAQQQVQRPQHALPPRPPANVAWRDTPTPPQNLPRYAAPNDPRSRSAAPANGQYGLPVHTANPLVPYQQLPLTPEPMSSLDLADLKAEVTQLITTTQSMFAHNPADVALRTKLQALLSLKQILDTQTLLPKQLEAVRQQIRALAPPLAPTPTPVLAPTPQVYQQMPVIPQFSPAFPTAASSTSTPPTLAQLLAGLNPPVQPAQPAQPAILNLADLLKQVSSTPQPASIPTPVPFMPPMQSLQPPIAPPIPPQSTPSALSNTTTTNLAALLAQFNKPAATPMPILPVSTSTPMSQLIPQPSTTLSAPASTDWLLKALSGMPGGLSAVPNHFSSQSMSRQASGPNDILEHIELTTASMKRPRMHLISRLYEAKPNICATCGRRFDATQDGKDKKARHMDWHFKVKDPDAAKRGVHRSWYISEKDWIEYKEIDETSPTFSSTDASATASGVKPKKQAKDRYISVPQDTLLAQAPCPICQEKFDTVWNVEANDFVWMDAINVGAKIYHATCFEEYSKGLGMEVPGTPDSVLGKRKAEAGGGEGKKVKAY